MTDYPDILKPDEVRAYLRERGITIGINRMRDLLRDGVIPTLPDKIAGKRRLVGKTALDRMLGEWGVT